MCTRYVIKVTLTHNEDDVLEMSIEPGPKRNDADKRRLEQFSVSEKLTEDSWNTLQDHMKRAQNVIFPDDDRDDGRVTGISKDVLSITIKGPKRKPLQLVDLPGLIAFHADQETIDAIKELVLKHVMMENSTVLAIVDGSSDPDIAAILTMCKEHARGRTIGIVRKPDKVSDTERFVKIVKGEEPAYELFEWHVLRNLDRDSDGANFSMSERNRQEKDFFKQSLWNQIPARQLGIHKLRCRLRKKYFAATNGPERLRARVVKQDHLFKLYMHEFGHSWASVASLSPMHSNHDVLEHQMPDIPPESFSTSDRKEYADTDEETKMASGALENSKGTELPNFYKPRRIDQFFWEFSRPWFEIAKFHVNEIHTRCKVYFEVMTKMKFPRTRESIELDQEVDGFDNPDIVATRFMETYIMPKLHNAKKEAGYELWRLEADRQSFAKNADDRFLLEQQEFRDAEQCQEFIAATRRHRNGTGVNGDGPGTVDAEAYAKDGQLSRPKIHQNHVAKGYLKAMHSHYYIARDIFIANILMQVEERHFLRKIEQLIPDDLSLDQIRELTKENDDTAMRKRQLREEKRRLKEAEAALQCCEQT
ncbi:P-loop containing nucleoside triphosphate hydrolase [Colletotrichum sp. SAR 10_99]|nr:P-loop containing nucleoside triphosphate hydrolase [Colletotrichum sp. SAR 10_99]